MSRLRFQDWLVRTVLTAVMCSYPTSFAQRINPVGEGELAGARRSNVSLLLAVDSSSTTAYSKEALLAPSRDPFIRFGPALSAEWMPNDRIGFWVYAPYAARVGLIQDPNFRLPGLDFKFQTGMADVMSGAAFELLRQGRGKASRSKSPFNLSAQVNFVAPTGESRFENEILPIGNGFWNATAGVGVSRILTSRTMIFANTGYTLRLARTFDNVPSYRDPLKLDPAPVRYVRAGVGFGAGKGMLINLQVDHSDVGAVYPVEKRFKVSRAGMQWVVNRKYGLPAISFIGVERVNGRSTFVVTLGLPFTFRLLGKDF